MADSTLAITDNRNRAVAVLNDATNRVDLSGSNLHSAPLAAGNANASVDSDNVAVVANSALNNIQTAGASLVSADSASVLRNFDALQAATPGIDSSSAILTGNATEANAVANRSGNLLNIDASNLSASGGVLNRQESDATVTAAATSTVRFVLNNPAGGVVTDSTVDVSGNTTLATASGNRASTALNGLASAGYAEVSAAGATGSINSATGTFSADATFGALNVQGNNGPITASIAGARAEIGLIGAADAVTGSTLRASGNQMVAEASGNFARTDIAMSVRPTGNGSAALTSMQSNTGNISASLTDNRVGISMSGAGVTGSTASVSGNRAIARATGNTAVNRITRGD